jgi:Carbamoyl-phosphate synthase L chain, ATP binding domain
MRCCPHRPGPHPSGGTLAVVWPYSTALQAGPVIRAHGWRAVAVLPPDPAAVGQAGDRPCRADWDAMVTAAADAATVARLLAGMGGVGGVLAGDEAAVPLAEDVARRLGLPGCDPATSGRRRDKGLMTEALAAAGLSHPVTVRVGTLDAALAAVDGVAGIGWPVVLKPPASCGGDGFAWCRDAAELIAAWHQTFAQPTVLGGVNETMIVQAFLPGPQFAVNTVTLRPGHHLVTDVWAERLLLLPGGGLAYERSDLLSPAHPLFGELTSYTRAALDAIGITWGAGHAEIRLDATGLPGLIDCAARLPGYYPQPLMGELLGLSQLEAAVLAVISPRTLAAFPPDYPPPGQTLTQLWLITPADGVSLDGAVLAQMATVGGVHSAFGHLEAGGPACRTTDLMSTRGGYNLAGPAQLVEIAARRLRALEALLYQPMPAAAR